MGIGLMWIITIGVLVTVVGFGAGLFVFALKLVLKSEDANRIDTVPSEMDN